ncbi:PepSY domain-containing protein [Aestuariirhabdus sp. Z084]|uniref:PepSY-associated TM helix domain-containing protein n=1 Tax=Aestuariirhabdus haliotis TaxID=2918751 RepID=UPI00201B40A2|nr:PepSY domain-containing protein [Aestuariirhabdus haliotis]MCL6415885.1 PepSY domain-containing protein [Aestuariirhabdus haliotis]MCL6419813.1 PepSY domain-containing protein [Aestuariirhabdus haliotis]
MIKTAAEKSSQNTVSHQYSYAWRWHFYAGLYVIPFMLMLSITGLIMLLYKPVIAPALYGELLDVTAEDGAYAPWTEQQQVVQQAYPDATITQLSLPLNAEQSTLFTVKSAEGENINVYLNPYSAKLLGSNSKDDSLYALADEIHGTFLLGKTGDALIELAAGFTLVLILSGLYMWWPRNRQSWRQTLLPQLRLNGRGLWKSLHKSLGGWLAIALLFLAITGLSWTGIWGAKIVQPWNSFPIGVYDGIPTSTKTHASLNPGVIEEIPWNLEQTPLPESGSSAGTAAITSAVNLDSVVQHAYGLGMKGFRVNLPRDERGVYTIVAATMNKDPIAPTQDRTVHIDQYTGNILMDIRFEDYGLMAKAMAIGVPLHMGLWGTANLVLNVLVCLGCIFLSISGLILWWKRRPAGARLSINAPKASSAKLWKGAMGIWLVIAVTVPLVGASLIAITLIDKLLIQRLLKSDKPLAEPS